MFEKNMNIGYLLDFYGDILPERKRSVINMYYNEDLSLAEIAQEIGISRQGVRDIIKKTEEELIFYEEKLGLAQKLKKLENEAARLADICRSADLPQELRDEIAVLSVLIEQ